MVRFLVFSDMIVPATYSSMAQHIDKSNYWGILRHGERSRFQWKREKALRNAVLLLTTPQTASDKQNGDTHFLLVVGYVTRFAVPWLFYERAEEQQDHKKIYVYLCLINYFDRL
jgi:hypothetical protein